MRQASHYRAPDPALAAAVVTPIIGFRRPAGEDRTFGFNALASDFQPEATKTAETSQIRAREGSVGHVEVFQMGSVRTPIFGGPRPLQPAATPQPRTALPTPSFMKSPFGERFFGGWVWHLSGRVYLFLCQPNGWVDTQVMWGSRWESGAVPQP